MMEGINIIHLPFRAYLVKVIKVLQAHLHVQINSVIDRFAQHVSACKVHGIPCFTSMRTKGKGVQSTGLPQPIQNFNVGPQVVELPPV